MELYKLIRPVDVEQLLKNRREQMPVQGTARERDFRPVVKLEVAGTQMMWLLSELDQDDIAFGLCRILCAELGSVWLEELADIEVEGLRVTQDTSFKPMMTLRGYAQLARSNGGLLIL